jgi:hypothetical protein
MRPTRDNGTAGDSEEAAVSAAGDSEEAAVSRGATH